MRKFIRKFYGRMLIEAATIAVIVNVLLQMNFDKIAIDRERSILPQIIILPLLSGLFIALFTQFVAKHNTNVLRRYEYSLREGGEMAFYRVFAILLIVLAAADVCYMIYKCEPFFDTALAYAVKDAQIRNEDPEIEQAMIKELESRYSLYITAERVVAAVTFLAQSAIYITGARRLVLEYRDPPDYWSGRKKGKGKR